MFWGNQERLCSCIFVFLWSIYYVEAQSASVVSSVFNKYTVYPRYSEIGYSQNPLIVKIFSNFYNIFTPLLEFAYSETSL